MFAKSAYIPQQQFHLLLNVQGNEQDVAVLPDQNRKFLVVYHGQILGELAFDQQFQCVFNSPTLQKDVLEQLCTGIKEHY